MKRWFLVVGLTAALVVVAAIQQAKISRLQERIAILESESASMAAAPSPGKSPAGRVLPGKSDNPRHASRTAPPGEEDLPGDDGGDEELGKAVRKMVDNPAGRALMNQGVKAMSAMWFRDLVDQFDLTREEEDYFLNLASMPMAAQQQIGLKIMNASTPEERQALVGEMEKAKEDARAAIKDFLNNDEDFAAYEEYEKRLPERQQLDGLRAVMNQAEVSLSPEQEEGVIEAMYKARTASGDTIDWQGGEGMEALARDDAIEKFEKDWEINAMKAGAEVAKVLQGKQLQAFKDYQEQMKNMQLMGIKMARKMFSDDEGAGSGDRTGKTPE